MDWEGWRWLGVGWGVESGRRAVKQPNFFEEQVMHLAFLFSCESRTLTVHSVDRCL